MQGNYLARQTSVMQQVPLLQPRAWRRARAGAALLLALTLALAGPLPSWAAGADERLADIEKLARERNPAALDHLIREKEALTAGASYPTRLLYLKLLRATYANAGKFKQAYATDEDIIRAATVQHDAAGVALGRLGQVGRYLDEDQPAAAMASLNTILRDYPDLADPEYMIASQALLADIYNLRGQFDLSFKHYYAAIDIATVHPEVWYPNAASLRIAVARVYINTKNPAKALETTAGINRKSLPGTIACSLEFTNGIALIASGKTAQGQEAFARALALARELDLRSMQAQILGNVADAYLHARDFPKAEVAARSALLQAEQTADINSLLMANANIGFALAGQGRMQEGLPFMDKVVASLRKSGAMADLSNMLMEKSQALEAAGMYKEALATVRERDTVTNELAMHERSKAIAALQEQFDAQRRSAQIDTLTRDNRFKDVELGNRTLRLVVTTLALVLALLVSTLVYVLYRKSVRKSARLKAMATEYEHDSLHDPLTGLSNRRAFTDRMAARQADAGAPADGFTLLDIDHFKRVNDEHGHAAGDAVLVEVARRLASVVRGQDAVVRWGGEEFLVYSHAVDPAQQAAVVQRILNVVSQAPVTLPNGTALAITVSAGSAALPFLGLPENLFDWQQAIEMADRALYHGKQTGRNRGNIVEGLGQALSPASSALDIRSSCEAASLRLQLVLPAPPSLGRAGDVAADGVGSRGHGVPTLPSLG